MILKGIPEVEELNGMVRFENHDELRYSLRSVFENLPWINHIDLITTYLAQRTPENYSC